MTASDVITYTALIGFLLGAVVALHGWVNRAVALMATGLAIAVPTGVLSLIMLLP
ncbi:hypothetical protein [Streptomyces sp. NBC_01601]|uniref:hypothetical protein n=1 Tax=Streptomyces sp. NBC_01601 TaxID=2975892 RepID=UPI002E282BA2|nr:hypothetical protein [Streptomyces sp. NBC_01601]